MSTWDPSLVPIRDGRRYPRFPGWHLQLAENGNTFGYRRRHRYWFAFFMANPSVRAQDRPNCPCAPATDRYRQVRSWLRFPVPAMPVARPLSLRLRTFWPRCPDSSRFLPLCARVRTPPATPCTGKNDARPKSRGPRGHFGCFFPVSVKPRSASMAASI